MIEVQVIDGEVVVSLAGGSAVRLSSAEAMQLARRLVSAAGRLTCSKKEE